MAKIPSKQYDSWRQYLQRIIPGILLCIGIGVTARYLERIVPEELFVINYVLIAIFIGMFVRNFILKRISFGVVFNAGIDFSAKIFLMVGVILIGARMNLLEVTSVGSKALLMIAGAIVLSMWICGWIGKKVFGERTGHLLGIGRGICGVSAIIALAPVIKAREKEILLAIVASLVTDFMVLFGLPVLGGLMGWGNEFSGYFAGVVTSNTAQAVAVGHSYSTTSGAIAVITKSARNALMPVVILIMAYIYTMRGLPIGVKVGPGLLWEKFPKFILGFLLGSLLTTLGVFPPSSDKAFLHLYQWLFVVSFAGIGAGVDFSVFNKKDLYPIIIGIIMTLIIAVYAYYWIRLVIGYA